MVDQGMLNKAQELMERFGSIATPPNLFKGYGDKDDVKSQFPVQLGSTDPDDRKYGIQNQLVTAGGGVVPGYGQATVGDDFFGWAKRKQDQAVLHQFYGYVLNNADLTKPESAQWWFTKFPWMKDLRLREIEREAEVQKRLAKIQITGPESDEDFMVLFMIDQGLLKKSDKPLYKLDSATIYKNQDEFKAGYWNPFTKTPLPAGIADERVSWINPVGSRPLVGAQNLPNQGGGVVRPVGGSKDFNLGTTLGVA